tara:strand:- start:175 stop:522 length:348 start_codon:yes stop_codon:yes gene_type:complete
MEIDSLPDISDTKTYISEIINKNEGAATVISLIYFNEDHKKINKYLELFLELEIVGLRLWNFYNKICKNNLKLFLTMCNDWIKFDKDKKQWETYVEIKENCTKKINLLEYVYSFD